MKNYQKLLLPFCTFNSTSLMENCNEFDGCFGFYGYPSFILSAQLEAIMCIFYPWAKALLQIISNLIGLTIQ